MYKLQAAHLFMKDKFPAGPPVAKNGFLSEFYAHVVSLRLIKFKQWLTLWKTDWKIQFALGIQLCLKAILNDKFFFYFFYWDFAASSQLEIGQVL